MKPYYQSPNATLYLGDCRTILPRLDRDSADLLLTDPPYGVRWRSNTRALKFEEIVGDDSTEAAVEGVRLALPVLKHSRHLYVFGRYDFSGLPIGSVTELVWDKGMIGPGDLELPWGSQHEYIQFATLKSPAQVGNYGAGNLAARLRKGSILACNRLCGVSVADHPTEKPVALLRQLIESSSCIGDLVLDPFVGVGSTLEAALVEGRSAVGIEIHEPYAEVAARRLQRVESGLRSLFGELAAC
jgi:DNA modification methylase